MSDSGKERGGGERERESHGGKEGERGRKRGRQEGREGGREGEREGGRKGVQDVLGLWRDFCWGAGRKRDFDKSLSIYMFQHFCTLAEEP